MTITEQNVKNSSTITRLNGSVDCNCDGGRYCRRKPTHRIGYLNPTHKGAHAVNHNFCESHAIEFCGRFDLDMRQLSAMSSDGAAA